MKFSDGTRTFEVTDQAHIDCFRAKGWQEVRPDPEPKKEPAKKAKAKTAPKE